ncbi:MAG: polyphosphate polymerase domain-containing protein [Saccharofermentanales bacterium]|jgi:hypothetical protein
MGQTATTNKPRYKKLTVQRSELKYLLGLEDRLFLLKALDTLLTPDAYGDYSGYSVRSVYFDGVDEQDYIGKKKKVGFQKRIRLRIYDTSDQTAKFEFKKKWSDNQIKESQVVSRADALEMLGGNFEVLRKYNTDTAKLGYELCKTMQYRPVSMVQYKRRAYTHPQFSTRITLDNELQYCNFNNGLFEPDNHNFINVTDITETILEVKYENFLLPYIQQVLQQCNLKKCHISKFGSSRALLDQLH